MAETTIQSFSLSEFIYHAKTLDIPNDELHFVQFMLTGKDTKNNIQAYLDVSRNALSYDYPITVARDFDSLLGVADDILVDSAISVSVVPNPCESLTSGIHLKYSLTFTDENGAESIQSLPFHHIPNFKFATWGDRCQIHIFFPLLAFGEGSQRGAPLTEEQYRQFYELGLRPAIQYLLPGDVSDWPPSYRAELFRARQRTGHMSYQSKMLGSSEVPRLVETIRRRLAVARINWATDFFFLHTIRGVKHSTQHEVHPELSDFAFQTLLEQYDIQNTSLENGEWWIDIGMEFHSPDELCLQWETASHAPVVQSALCISEEHASRITSFGSSKYERDISSHLMGVSGCRIQPGSRAQGVFEAAYLQMYSTDKALTYNMDGRYRGKTMRIKDAMGTEQPSLFTKGLRSVFVEAMVKNASNARIELRVPVRFVNEALIELDISVIRSSLLAFRRTHWWNFRVLYVEAINRLLITQQVGDPKLRVRPNALLLTAACVWLINSLHSRPDDGKASRALIRRILPLTDSIDPDPTTLLIRSREYREETDDYWTPYNPYGVIFLRRLILNVDVPRMADNQSLSPLPDDCFSFLFEASEEEIQHRYAPIGIVPRGVESTQRVVTNKTKRTPRFVEETPPDNFGVLFDLASKGFTLPPPPVDDGSDMEIDGEPMDVQLSLPIDEAVTKMYRQFLVDVINKSPSPRRNSKPSYSTLTVSQKLRVTEDLYNNMNFKEIWRQCTWKLAMPRDIELAFSHLFPERGHEAQSSIQNYKQCQYYLTWKDISTNGDPASVEAIRMAIRKRFFRLKWIPYACSDKMWRTSLRTSTSSKASNAGKTDKTWTRFPPGTDGPAPFILCRIKPHWDDQGAAEIIEL